MIKIKPFTFNPFMENTYILFDETKEALIIDPGCYEKEEQDELVKFIESEGLKVKSLLNTHGHIDHVLGNDFVKRKFNVDLIIGEHDEETLRSVGVYAANYGFQNYTPAQPNKFLKEGDTVKFGNSVLKVYFTPGHAPGHIVFVNEEENVCIGGDVLFEGSIGRTDLPGGDFDTLIKSIHNKLFKFDDDMVVYPGHGGPTTIGNEKATNPFCALKK
ncbi:glyoxylase-like metal-dependent hydrolase (beta-lactamase superfamily II) [Roseivirga ehrenbergii]|uniref:MBL fold metallo-hydrolase n=1 Tax=Roseivirga ehrenbergii (strain DSM 102268 / JCM 13514 / KCTC 12282 / NCIMB 14502 / KMM 6017) TaxID=279360 RepID=A0A150XT36_ROSEK|nr:MBL fold metallo-hydrolase [Roseivirga ehrenbergii]KYG81854.1 MBL fold metallo-hydrolase [Roseivirga ehrenbergii]TCL01664.1 glyoxylase-like metal-dependent hydrolase (beta-lactamase superfamily II) [Roseivirga ehrenbergii]